MNVVLNGMQDRCSSYVDDVLIYSGEWKEHLGHIEEVLAKLKDAGLMAKVEKCEWGKSQLIYLGHLIGKGRVAVPEDRASAIANYVQPTTKKGVRAFLGTAGYYRRFIPKFGAIAAPLTQLMRKAEPEIVSWTLESEQAFSKLCKCLSDVCVLTIPLPSDQYRLQTDASGQGLGAVLSVVREGEELPVAYYSANYMVLRCIIQQRSWNALVLLLQSSILKFISPDSHSN